jgi:hypothetical protein
MAEFISLHQDNASQEYAVNVAKIIKFWRGDGHEYTVVELEDGKNLTVKEKPQEIWQKIHQLNRS